MKRIGLLTSGGDASGMNAAIRAVARTAASMGVEVVGFERGYDGLVSNTWIELNTRSVSGILELGGTMLKSARSELFRTEEGRKQAALVVQQNRLDGMVIIGGNGSQTGGYLLGQLGVPVVGVASTIDNDLYGFDLSLIHISEPTRLGMISYAVFCLKKKKNNKKNTETQNTI